MKKAIISLLFTFIVTVASSQDSGVLSVDSLNQAFINWYNQSPQLDNIQGASVEQAYNELLKGKTPEKKIVVAVIDGGVDIMHPDLAGKIWTNTDEIANNGIDDDNNGYTDDVHGWNFIGNEKGENIVYENMEYVRILKKLTPDFSNITSIDQVDPEDVQYYNLYLKCKQKYDEELSKYKSVNENIEKFEKRLEISRDVLKNYLKKDKFTREDVEKIKSDRESVKLSKEFYLKLYKRGFSEEGLTAQKNYINKYLQYYLNLEFEPRLTLNDNPYDINDTKYGNNDVKGERPDHGTFVSGVIAANRGNGFGTDGISSNVEIMVLRVVPDGDERDKDVALAIRYAVDNGANIINMSFGKYYSIFNAMMECAIRYADDHNVLMVKSAGNESDNLDLIECFPTNKYIDGGKAKNWINVGATANKSGKNFCGPFSNYGKNSVDVFAPGVNIVSLSPEKRYDMANGTSFSGPVVAGVAALVWSYFPELTASELKTVLLESVNKYDKLKVIVPNKQGKKDKSKFAELSITGGTINAYNAIKKASSAN